MTVPIAPIDVEAYRAQTDRLCRLREFLVHFAPAFGETTGPADDARELVDKVTPLALLTARNIAIQSAFEAAERIARNS